MFTEIHHLNGAGFHKSGVAWRLSINQKTVVRSYWEESRKVDETGRIKINGLVFDVGPYIVGRDRCSFRSLKSGCG